MIKSLFSRPTFEQEDEDFRAKFINGFAWGAIALLLLAILSRLFAGPQSFTLGMLSGMILVMLIALYLLRRGQVGASGVMIIVLGWLGISIQAFAADGVKDVILVGFIALGLLASITINWRIGTFVTLSGLGVIWTLALLEANNYFVPRSQDPLGFARDLSLVFIAITVLVYFGTKRMQDAIQEAAERGKNLARSNESLRELNRTLEDRVESRTSELTAANARNERRAGQFEAIAHVARTITSLQDEDTLLSRLAHIISDHFGFYHAGIYLLDEEQQHAILRASNSEGGRRMLARRHKLLIGQAGIVGHVAASGTPRIALDVESDAAFRENPDLPGTRSEMALPLKFGDQVIGVLDLQSAEPNAFIPEDAEVIYALADQVAIALQNARAHESTRRLLEEAQRTSGSYLREAWRLLQSQEETVGYLVSEDTLKPLEKFVSAPHIHKVVSQGEVLVESGDTATLAVPVRLRDEVVGVLDIHIPAGHDWDSDEVDIVKAVADRLSLALESATLLKSTQKQAELERLTAEISGKISASINLRNVLETAVEELGHALPGSEVVIQFETGPSKNKAAH